MPRLLKYIAQSCSDAWYQDYKSDFQFFTLDDFINNCGNTIAGIYQRFYDQQYAMLRQERKDEVVTFDVGMLSEQILKVTNVNGILSADILQPIMTFMSDQSSTGIQLVYDDKNRQQIERTTFSEAWQLEYAPKVNKIFFYPQVNKLSFINKGDCTIQEVRVLYVPAMFDEAVVADTVADEAIQKTILEMKQLADKNVVKKSLDNNENAILQSEIDKEQVR